MSQCSPLFSDWKEDGIIMQKWVVSAKRADFQKIAEKFHIDPVIARLIRNRDVISEDEVGEYLTAGLESLNSPWLLKDMNHAVDILLEKISQGSHIRIIGDYDIDGVTSTYILKTGLRRLGAAADVKIPDRITDGYGINEHLVEQAASDGVDTIVTCDNGIAAIDQIARARAFGMTVIVTDHHEIPYEEEENGTRTYRLPPADAVINPRQKDCPYPFKGICGAVVAFKLMQALYERAGFDPGDIYDDFLEFAAIATVGDIMDLKGENRVIVKEGLKRLHHTKNPGLLELIRVHNMEPEDIQVYHIGFVLGPCLNASGRLDTAVRALSLLEAGSREDAARLAGDLKSLNECRKEMTVQGTMEAFRVIEESELKNDSVLVVFLPDCHESLAGIIAGRVRERYHKPAIVLTRTSEGVKGSGRSIESYSMYDELCRCREYLTKFGGHPMAAGMSLAEENVEAFRRKLNRCSSLTEEDFIEKIVIDVPMPISYIRRDLIEQLELLQPFGKGNEKPVFAQKNIRLLGCRIFGKNRNVVKMQAMDENGYAVDAVYFGDGDEFSEAVKGRESLSILYYPTINRYQGRENIQITIQSFQ